MKPKKVITAPASGERGRLGEIALDDEDADSAEDEASEDGAAAHDLEPVIEHADLAPACRAPPAAARVGAGRAQCAVDLHSCPRPRGGA